MKRFMLLLLVLSLLLSVLVACGAKNNDSETKAGNEENQSGTNETATETEAKETRIPSSLPSDLDFSKDPDHTFSVCHWSVTGEVGESWIPWEEVYVSEYTGDLMDNLVYDRDSAVSERLGVDFETTYLYISDLNEQVKKMVSGGYDEYDMMIQRGVQLNKIAFSDYFLNLNELPYIDLQKPWWNQDSLNSLVLGEKYQFAASDILVLDKSATACMYYNAAVAEDNGGVGNMYELAKNKQWTIEEMVKRMELVATDLDNDGTTNSVGDLVGFWGGDDPIHLLFNGAGHYFMINNPATGYMEYTFGEPDAISDMVDIFEDVMYNPTYINTSFLSKEQREDDMFEKDMALFAMTRVKSATLYRSMKSAYGILPIPMFDEYQERYYHEVSPHHDSLLFVPSSVLNEEMAGAVIEELSRESYYTVIPNFYDVVIEGKGTRDEQSKEMLKIIFETRVYDPGLVFDMADFGTIVLRWTAKGTSDMAHLYEEYEDRIDTDLRKMNEKIDSLNGY
ncbi:MAG: hypothetical protein IJU20_01865 [Clostridia bacterium]|nr:hypothetical protein [Clostridia bacterium]